MKRKKIRSDESDELEEFDFAEIDKYALDKEWINQEKMLGKVGQELAKARMEVDRAKSAHEVQQATVDKRIRTNPQKYGLDKITETSIANEVVLQMEKKSTGEKLIQAKYNHAILQAALDRLNARGKAISDLIYLHSIEYFGKPKVPRGMKGSDIDRMKEDRIPGIKPKKRK